MEQVLIIKHKKPFYTHLDGKWREHDTDLHFYLEDNGELKHCELIDNDVRTILMDSVVKNPSIPGRFNEKQNALIYRVPLEDNRFKAILYSEIEGLIRISLNKENKEDR
jgi:hypothetical protein